MSTRCHTIIIKGDDKAYVYRHSDGYSEDGAGYDLKTFINYYKDNFETWSVNDLGVELENEEYGFEFENSGIHGDEDYIYFIDMDKKTLECYEYSGDFPESEIKEKEKLVFKKQF